MSHNGYTHNGHRSNFSFNFQLSASSSSFSFQSIPLVGGGPEQHLFTSCHKGTRERNGHTTVIGSTSTSTSTSGFHVQSDSNHCVPLRGHVLASRSRGMDKGRTPTVTGDGNGQNQGGCYMTVTLGPLGARTVHHNRLTATYERCHDHFQFFFRHEYLYMNICGDMYIYLYAPYLHHGPKEVAL